MTLHPGNDTSQTGRPFVDRGPEGVEIITEGGSLYVSWTVRSWWLASTGSLAEQRAELQHLALILNEDEQLTVPLARIEHTLKLGAVA